MNSWAKVKLKQLGDFRNGANYPKGSYGKGDKIVNVKDLFKGRYINPDNLVELKKEALKNKSLYLTQHGDLLFTRSSLVKSGAGMVAMVYEPVEDILFCGFIIRYRVKQEIVNPLFLLYLLRSPMYRKLFTDGSVQTNISNINQETLGNIEVYLPVIDEQNLITQILDNLDAKIELNNKINQELEAMAKTLYDYWFVQFDFPNEQGKPYKSSGGKMVYNEELKREIPEGWKVENLKNNSLTDLIKPRIDLFEGEKTYLATSDVVNNEINFGADKITFENRESRANMQPIPNSIWFAKMKKSKKVLYIGEYSNYFLENFILSTGFAGLKCKEKYFVEYIWGFVNNYNFEKIKDILSNGATQEAINNDSMAYIPLIIPNGNILKEYHKKVFEIYKKIYLNQIENQKLAELRDWLLPMLMNGQIKVGEVEEKLSMAAEPSVEYKKG